MRDESLNVMVPKKLDITLPSNAARKFVTPTLDLPVSHFHVQTRQAISSKEQNQTVHLGIISDVISK